ncbi:DNA repair protein RecO [Patescibacteria group bacterium]
MATYMTKGVILKRRNIGEADRLLTLFTDTVGKRTIIAKGVRRPQSKLGGSLDLLTNANIQIAEGRNLDVVTQVEVIDSYRSLKENLIITGLSFYLAELVDQFVEESYCDTQLYNLITETLREFSDSCSTREVEQLTSNDEFIFKLVRRFELKLLDSLGYAPTLKKCAVCNNELPEQKQYSFLAGRGGVLCASCIQKESFNIQPNLSLEALKLMHFLKKDTLEQIRQIRFPEGIALEVEKHLRNFLQYHLDRNLKSAAFLKKIEKFKI